MRHGHAPHRPVWCRDPRVRSRGFRVRQVEFQELLVNASSRSVWEAEPRFLYQLRELPQCGVKEGHPWPCPDADGFQCLVVGPQSRRHVWRRTARPPVACLRTSSTGVDPKHPGRKKSAPAEQCPGDRCAVDVDSGVLRGGGRICAVLPPVRPRGAGRRHDIRRRLRLGRYFRGWVRFDRRRDRGDRWMRCLVAVLDLPRATRPLTWDEELLSRMNPVRVLDALVVGLVDPRPLGAVAIGIVGEFPELVAALDGDHIFGHGAWCRGR